MLICIKYQDENNNILEVDTSKLTTGTCHKSHLFYCILFILFYFILFLGVSVCSDSRCPKPRKLVLELRRSGDTVLPV